MNLLDAKEQNSDASKMIRNKTTAGRGEGKFSGESEEEEEEGKLDDYGKKERKRTRKCQRLCRTPLNRYILSEK